MRRMHDSRIVVGIDPGKGGAAVALFVGRVGTPALEVAIAEDAYCRGGEYSPRAMVDFLRRTSPALVVVERQHAMPAQGRTSCLSIGYGWGLWVMAATALGIPQQSVSAKTWQTEVLRGVAGTDTKARAFRAVESLVPTMALVPPGRKRPHDGIADGTCMAIWAVRAGLLA